MENESLKGDKYRTTKNPIRSIKYLPSRYTYQTLVCKSSNVLIIESVTGKQLKNSLRLYFIFNIYRKHFKIDDNFKLANFKT